MKIAMLGAGDVGGTLGKRWAQLGHEVVFGVREPAAPRYRKLVEEAGERASAAAVADAADGADVVTLAVPWKGVDDALATAGDLSGKVLLDATNPFAGGVAAATGERSGGERVAELAAGARVVKIFNSTGWNVMRDPRFPDGAATMPYCGDDVDAKATARDLAEELGFHAVDAGGLDQAGRLEGLAFLWVELAYEQGLGREIAFRLMQR